MKKEDIYGYVIDCVSKCTGIDRHDLITSKREECTDARSILIQVLSAYLNDSQIASLMKITIRSVNYLRNGFSIRSSKWMVRKNYEEVRKMIGNIL